jgi:ribosomal protein S18 acetylase RimI-like enzyme
MKYQIRTALPTEKQTLETFLTANAGKEYRSLANAYLNCMFSSDFRRPTFLVAIENDNIIGSVAYTHEFFTLEPVWGISWLNVHPSKRNRGLGRRLMETCMSEISNKAARTVTLILATLPGKSALYDHLGFQKGGVDHNGGCLMTKTLPAGS